MEQAVRDILVSMKTELSKGWIKGTLSDENGVCVYGALVRTGTLRQAYCTGGGGVAGRSSPGPTHSWMLSPTSPSGHAINAIASEVGETWQTLALWNDHPDRKVDDITDAIDRLLTRGHPLKKNARKRMRRSVLVPA